MTEIQFTELYRDKDFSKTLKSMAYRYYNTYRKKFESNGLDVDDIEQELWIDAYESNYTDNKAYLVKQITNKIHRMLRDFDRDIRAVDDIDIKAMSYENENGELETDDETMSRLVYHGQGRYV